MNTHEAIKILRNTAWLGTNEDREKTEQAIEVVAEALNQEPSCRNTRQVDFISRQEAIEYLAKEIKLHEIFNETEHRSRAIKALYMAIEAVEQVPSEDCIDRYSALAELDPLSYEYKAIKELPSVVPKGSDEQ